MIGAMTHRLATVHAHMPAGNREASPLPEWPDEADWTSRRHIADDHGPWCQTDGHAEQLVPGAWSETVSHSGVDENDYPFMDLYAFWATCEECHERLVTAQGGA